MNREETLNLTNLKYYCDAVKLGSVSASAKANFVTQSAVSQGIGKLEAMLGLSLVAHHPKHFRITPAGEALFHHAQDVLRRAAALKNAFVEKDGQHMGSLDFACTYSFALAVVPRHLRRFKIEYPEVKINFQAGKNELVKQMLMQGTIDFGILPDEGDLDGFEKRKIYEGVFKAYASKHISRRQQKKLEFILADSNCKERILPRKCLF